MEHISPGRSSLVPICGHAKAQSPVAFRFLRLWAQSHPDLMNQPFWEIGDTGGYIFNKCHLVILRNTQFGIHHWYFWKGGQTLKLGFFKSAAWECVFSMHQEVWEPLMLDCLSLTSLPLYLIICVKVHYDLQSCRGETVPGCDWDCDPRAGPGPERSLPTKNPLGDCVFVNDVNSDIN